MGDQSAIQWTDATWNPVTGCSKVSPGCAHCYAERVAIRLWPSQYPPIPCLEAREDGIPYASTRPRVFTDVQCHDDRLDQPLRWKKPRKVFVNSMSDLFHEDVPDAFIDRVFAVMALAPQHTFQILTKRERRMYEYLSHSFRAELISDASGDFGACHANLDALGRWPLPNVWLGPSIENQAMGDKRFPIACELGEAGWNVMVSMEPLLCSVTLPARFLALGRKGWVIVGGESGPKARACHTDWIAEIVRQCAGAGVPCFVKQLGSNGHQLPGGYPLRDRKGGDMAEWPEDLRVREMPGGC